MKIEDVVLREVLNFFLNPKGLSQRIANVEQGEVDKFIT